MKVAIITVNYNGKNDTLELLKSLKLLKSIKLELRTIVVDNGSTDGSVNSIHAQYPEVDIIQTGQNLGFSGGVNKGIEYGQIWGADYFLLINNDCLISDQDLITKLVEIKADIVSPKIYFAKGFEFHKYQEKDLGKVIWFAGGKFDWDNIGNIHHGLDQVDKGQYDEVAEAEIFSGACVLINKEVFEKVGLFDEKYFLYFEDSDFAKRARGSGFKIYYHGEVSILHKVSRSAGIGSEITDYYHSRNRLIFGLRYGKTRTKLALIRQSIWLLLFGRKTQRKGVLGYYLGIRGGVNLSHLRGELEYPLKLSIGIVNYNTADLTKKLLDSIFKKSSGFDPKNMEVIILDNGQLDPVKNLIKDYPVKYLVNEENEGFSKGYNKTIKYALGQYYLMLNSDIEVLENGLKGLVETEDQLNGEAVLGGKLLFPDGGNQDSCFHLPTITGAIKEYFLKIKGSYFMFEPQGFKPVRVEGLVMACMLIPKQIIYNVGLLDEGTFIFFEDIEYCRRLKCFGVPVYFVPKAKFIHHHGASTKIVGREKSYQLLKKSAKHYHGSLYYKFLSFVLRLGQKFGRVQTPQTKWTK